MSILSTHKLRLEAKKILKNKTKIAKKAKSFHIPNSHLISYIEFLEKYHNIKTNKTKLGFFINELLEFYKLNKPELIINSDVIPELINMTMSLNIELLDILETKKVKVINKNKIFTKPTYYPFLWAIFQEYKKQSS
jgi:hypothetical protein